MNDIVEQVFLQIVADAMFRGNIKYVMENKEENCFLHAIGADSLDTLQIMIALRDTFDINITEEKAENFVKMSYSEILHMLESAGASEKSMQRKLARKQVKPVKDKKQAQESPKPVADKEQTQKQVKSVADNKQAQKIEFKTILQQAENLVTTIKLFETSQNNPVVKSEKQNKPVVVLRTMKDGKPYCELLGKKCNRPERPNNTGKDYCEFMNCVIYKNFQRLR